MIVGSKVSHQCIEGEVVIIDLQTGSYYSLVDVAAALWELIAAGRGRSEVLDLVSSAYGAEAVDAAATFLDELRGEGLIFDGTAARLPVHIQLPAAFTPPRAEKFTDMQELLTLDPIHEVDASGWPYKPLRS